MRLFPLPAHPVVSEHWTLLEAAAIHRAQAEAASQALLRVVVAVKDELKRRSNVTAIELADIYKVAIEAVMDDIDV